MTFSTVFEPGKISVMIEHEGGLIAGLIVPMTGTTVWIKENEEIIPKVM